MTGDSVGAATLAAIETVTDLAARVAACIATEVVTSTGIADVTEDATWDAIHTATRIARYRRPTLRGETTP